jgi:hypothetical protein
MEAMCVNLFWNCENKVYQRLTLKAKANNAKSRNSLVIAEFCISDEDALKENIFK